MTDDERLVRDLGVLADRLEQDGDIGPAAAVRTLACAVANPTLGSMQDVLLCATSRLIDLGAGEPAWAINRGLEVLNRRPPRFDTLRLGGRQHRGVRAKGVELRHDEETPR